jgi:hypothetical protein
VSCAHQWKYWAAKTSLALQVTISPTAIEVQSPLDLLNAVLAA